MGGRFLRFNGKSYEDLCCHCLKADVAAPTFQIAIAPMAVFGSSEVEVAIRTKLTAYGGTNHTAPCHCRCVANTKGRTQDTFMKVP